MSSRRRVVVTGLGVISSLGKNSDQFWDSILRCSPGIGPMEIVDRKLLRFQNAAEVWNYRSEDFFDPARATILDRFSEFALVAAHEALSTSGIEWTPELQARAGVVTGTAVGGQTTEDASFADLYLHKKTRFNPLSIARVMANAPASQISMETGICGPVYTISTACSSANHAIGQAFWMVRDGLVDIALAGGSEAPFSLGNLKAWEAMRIVSTDTCRPFSKNRSGLIIGEGGGIIVLESRDLALSRGAPIFGEVVGFGMSSDAHHITQPSADGAARAMKAALRDGDIAPEAVGYINAHGTATQANDATETAAIRSVFGRQAGLLAVSSTKSLHGHALGAAGALEAIATILALQKGVFPPTANYAEADPACDLDVVPNQARQASCEYALSNSFAFGGLNAVLAFRAPS